MTSLLGKSELHPAKPRHAETASLFKNGTAFFVDDLACLPANVMVVSLGIRVVIWFVHFSGSHTAVFPGPGLGPGASNMEPCEEILAFKYKLLVGSGIDKS